jgi:iron-sulfur cluster assembly accessory protein
MHHSLKLQISNSAIAQLEKILSQHPGKFLRISVLPGGCSGFEYNLILDETSDKDDIKLTPNQTVTILIDPMSFDLIQGSELDYTSDLIGAAFKLKNPNAATSCGCGNSFSM